MPLSPAARPQPDELEPVVADAVAAVDADRLVALLQELVRVPSVTGSAAESEAQHLLARRLDAAGMDVDLWSIDLPSLTADPDFPGSEAPRDEAWGLVGTWGGDDGPTLVLNGHIDVVPPGDPSAWTVSPWQGEVRDGSVLGRGSCDMKAGLACHLMAVEALAAAGVRLRGRVQVQSVVGEEDGGLGTFATLRRSYRGDYAIIGEPTGTDLVTACAGALTFRLRVPGVAAHGSMRLAGVDAVEKYLPVHAALRALEARRNADVPAVLSWSALPYPISVGVVRAGEWASTVPDLLVAEGRLGVALGEPVEQARRALEDAVRQACAHDAWLADNPVQVEWWGGQFASAQLDPDAPLTRLTAGAAAAVSGRTPAVSGITAGSDQRLLLGLGGIPTLLYGPGDLDVAHAPDEHVPVADMVQVARTLVVLAARVCGTRESAAPEPWQT